MREPQAAPFPQFFEIINRVSTAHSLKCLLFGSKEDFSASKFFDSICSHPHSHGMNTWCGRIVNSRNPIRFDRTLFGQSSTSVAIEFNYSRIQKRMKCSKQIEFVVGLSLHSECSVSATILRVKNI